MNKQATIITIGTQKGGAGKTTTAVHTAYALGETGKKVLLIDMDPQSSATWLTAKIPPNEIQRTVLNLFKEEDTYFKHIILPSRHNNLWLAPSHLDLMQYVESLGAGNPLAIIGLRKKLDEETKEKFDFIIIDSPPSLYGACVTNSLVMSDYYVLPLEAESVYGLIGVEQFLKAIRTIQKGLNPTLRRLGILITRSDYRTTAAKALNGGKQQAQGLQYARTRLPQRPRFAPDRRRRRDHHAEPADRVQCDRPDDCQKA